MCDLNKKETTMKKLICILFCCCLLLTGCGNDTADTPKEAGVDYDVIVVGGDPEGVCAAVSSARNGLKTLLIEDDEALGGLMTLGKLNFIDICESRDGSILTQGLFMEFYNAVGGTAFDVETAKQFFYDWVANEPNATLKLNTVTKIISNIIFKRFPEICIVIEAFIFPNPISQPKST